MHHARLGTGLLARLCPDHHFRRYVFLELARRNPHQTVREVFPHTAFRCSSFMGMQVTTAFLVHIAWLSI